jgi:hypothetical protein
MRLIGGLFSSPSSAITAVNVTAGTRQGVSHTFDIRALVQGSVAGLARGEHSTDLQTERAVNTQVASGAYSVIVGGLSNTAAGDYSFAGGRRASDGGFDGVFIFADSQDAAFVASVQDSFNIRAAGGMFLETDQQTVNGATSGDMVCSQPQQGATWKKVVIYLNALLGAATYTFPTPFTHTPNKDGEQVLKVTALSASSVTVTGTTTTGLVILEGF